MTDSLSKIKITLLKIKDKKEEYYLDNVPLDLSIIELQKLIFNECEIPISEQYLFFLSKMDGYFYENIDNFFSVKPLVSKEKIISLLSKILQSKDIKKLDFTKKKISKEFILEFLDKKKINSYLKSLNINFQNGIENIDLKDTIILGDSFVESNRNLNLTQFDIIDKNIFLYSKNDFKDPLILKKYFPDYKIKDTKETILTHHKEIMEIYENTEIINKFKEEYGKTFDNYNDNTITDLSIIYNNFINTECDIQKLFNSISMNSNVVFGKILIRRQKQYYKIYRPKYFGDEANITKKLFNSWRLFEFSVKEKLFFDNNAFIDLKVLYPKTNDYINVLINHKNQILIKIQSKTIELEILKNTFFDFINKYIKEIKKKNFLDSNNYKILNIGYQKKIQVDKNIPIKNLRTLLQKNKKYIFPLDFPVNERQFIYGYKRTSNFMIDKNINYLLEKIVITQKQTNKGLIIEYLKNTFEELNIEEKYKTFLMNYEDEKKIKYNLEMPYLTIFTKEDNFIISMKNFVNLKELKVVNILLENIFQEFMVKKSTKGIKEKLNDITNLNSNSISNNNNSNNDSKGFIVGLNSNNNSNTGLVVGLNTNSLSNNQNGNNQNGNNQNGNNQNGNRQNGNNSEEEIDISFGFEDKNYTSYMKAMRNYYDKELFDGKNYTIKCRRQPYIVSKQHFFKNIQKPNIIGGLDHQIVNEKGELVDSENYYLESKDKKKIFICPRIWCASCNIPINPLYFSENKKCPKCGGIEVTKKEKMNSKKSVIIVKAENNYFKTDDKNKKNYLKKIFGDIPIPKELKGNELRMYPKYLDEKKNPDNKGLPCCYKGMSIEKQESNVKLKKQKKKVEVLDQKIFRFIKESKFPLKKIKRVAILPNDLDILLGNTETNKVLEKLDELSQSENKTLSDLNKKKKLKTSERNLLKDLEIKKKGYEYSFKFYGEIKNIGVKKELSTYKLDNNYVCDNLFRLSVGNDNNNSFINCFEELLNLIGIKKSVTELINNETLFTPLLFCQLNNGNLIEIFKSDIDSQENFEEWKIKYKTNILSLKIKEDIYLKNLYSSFTNFKKYHFSNSFKNPEFYLDLLGTEGFLFEEKKNIIIIEKTSYDIDSELNLICPKSFLGSDNIDLDKNTIILINTGQYYEPIIGIRFIKRKIDLNKFIDPYEPIIDFNIFESNESKNPIAPHLLFPQINNLLHLMLTNCKEIKQDLINNLYQDNIENLFYFNNNFDNIDKYIINNNFKIEGILLKNKLLLPIIPSGITTNIIKDIENKNYMKDKYLSLKKYNELIKENDNLNSYTIKSIIIDKDNIKGAILINGSIIQLKEEKKTQYDDLKYDVLEYDDINIDNKIMGKISSADERVTFNNDYNNSIFEIQKLKFIFNNYIRDEENETERNIIKKIIINKVVPLKIKKKKLKPILKKIFDNLFYFGVIGELPEFFSIKKTKKCWNLPNTKCKDDCVIKNEKCKNFMTKKNILTQKENKTNYFNLLQDELLRKKGLELITKKFNILTDLDNVKKIGNSKNILIFSDDMFEYYDNDLFRKTKEKYVRPIELFNTILQNTNLLLNKSNIDKINPQRKTKVIKKKTQKIMGTTQNIFGIEKKNPKIKAGECIFPYKLTLKQKTASKKKSEFKIINECVPSTADYKRGSWSADGLFCPTKVDKIYNKPENYNEKGKHKFWTRKKMKVNPYYVYKDNDNNRPKGYCDMREYIKRTKKKTEKINPRCIPEFKYKKSDTNNIPTNYTENGKDYTCLVEDNPDKILDKFTPQLICPIRVNDENVYDRVNNNTESCFIDK